MDELLFGGWRDPAENGLVPPKSDSGLHHGRLIFFSLARKERTVTVTQPHCIYAHIPRTYIRWTDPEALNN